MDSAHKFLTEMLPDSQAGWRGGAAEVRQQGVTVCGQLPQSRLFIALPINHVESPQYFRAGVWESHTVHHRARTAVERHPPREHSKQGTGPRGHVQSSSGPGQLLSSWSPGSC